MSSEEQIIQLTPEICQAIDQWVLKYPPEQKRSAVLAGLRIIQRAYGWLSDERMRALAEYLDLPPMDVYEVASFYSMYERKPIGRYKLAVCMNISCHLCGSDNIIKHLESRLGICMGETTSDGLFTLRRAECLAACTDAPILQVDDRDYYKRVTPEIIDQVLEQLHQAGRKKGRDDAT